MTRSSDKTTWGTGSRALQLERLEDRLLWNAVPEVTFTGVPAAPFLNEPFSFDVNFNNDFSNAVTSDPGFGPFVDVALPSGIDLSGVTFLGQAINFEVVGFYDATDMRWEDAAGGAGEEVTEHPLNSAVPLPAGPTFGSATLTDDYQLITVQLPFGSYVVDQPTSTLQFNVATNGGVGGTGTAVAGQALDLAARGGFMFGEDEFDNPMSDPPVIGTAANAQTTPTVIDLVKDNDRPEREIPTGENYVTTYSLMVNVANLETVGVSGSSGGLNDVIVQDILPSNFIVDMTFGGGDGVLVSGGGAGSVTSESIVGGVLSVVADSLTGSNGSNELLIQYRGYYEDATIDDVAAPDNTQRLNEAQVIAGYDPDGAGAAPLGQVEDGVDSGGMAGVNDGDGTDFEITVKQLDIQKGVDDGLSTPGDINTWTLTVEVSDYDSFSNLTLQDVFSDGLEYVVGSAELTVMQDGVTTISNGLFDDGAPPGADNWVVSVDGGTGVTTMDIDLSDALVRLGHATGGTLTGDILSDATMNGATTAVITYQTRVLQDFRTTTTGADTSVDLGDSFLNTTTITGTSQGGFTESDGSNASVEIEGIQIDKQIYAVNLNTGFTDAAIGAGGNITYRLTLTLPAPDTENLIITDYLPLPVFEAITMTNTFNTTPSATPPPVGQSGYGPSHNLNGFTFSGSSPNDPPLITTDATANTISFNFGSFDSATQMPTTIDILFTVEANDKPFADGLDLTNQMQVSYGTTGSTTVSAVDIVQVELVQPSLEITKGVVSTDRPGTDETYVPDPPAPAPVVFTDPGSAAAPFSGTITSANLDPDGINSDAEGIDAGDIVKFAVVLENTGQDDALETLFRDTLASGFEIPAGGINFQVYDGAGTEISTDTAGTYDLLVDQSGGAIAVADIASYFFDNVAGAGDMGGVRLVNPIVEGIIDPTLDTPNSAGTNIIIITYDLQVDDELDAGFGNVSPDVQITNTAEILEFYANPMGSGGRDFTDDDMGMQLSGFTDDASVTPFDPSVSKDLVSSDEASTTGNNLAIGERATYELTITVPEGTVNGIVVVDDIPVGMDFDPTNFVLDTSGFSGQKVGGGALVTGDIMVTGGSGSGSDVTFTFPDIEVNASTGSNNNELVLRYEAVVLDIGGNTDGQPLANTPSIDWTGNPDGPQDGNTETATVVLPNLALTKTFIPNTGDAGDVVTIQIQVNNTAGTAAAFDVDVTDTIDSTHFTFAGNASDSSGTFTLPVAGPGVVFSGGTVAAGAIVTLSFDVTLTNNVDASAVLLNTATVTAADTHSGSPAEERDVFGATGNDSLTVDDPLVSKALTDTEIDNSAGSNNNDDGEAVVGEILTYTITITLPEGETQDVTLTDTLEAGLGFRGLVSITPSSGVSKTTGAANFSDVVPSVSADARTVTYDLDTILNANTDDANDATPDTPDTLTIVYEAIVTGIANDGDTLNNSATLQWNGVANSTSDSSSDVTIIEPELEVIKQVEVDHDGAGFVVDADGDAGDPIRYTITIQHTASSDTDAFDGTFIDNIPSEITIGTVTVMQGATDLIGSGVFEVSGNTVRTVAGQSYDLLAGAGGGANESIVIVVNGTINGTATPNETLTNTASTTYGTIDGDGTDRSTFVPDADNDELVLTADDDATTTIINVTPVKSIVSTSESHTGVVAGAENLVVGEIVRYRIEVEIPETTSADFIIQDRIPAGLAYLDGTAMLALVSSAGTGLTSNDVGLDTGLTGAGVAGSSATGVTPSYLLPDSNVSTERASDEDTYLSGTDVFFKLGDLTNGDGDTNPEFVIIEFNALVVNDSANQAVNNADGSDLDTELDNQFDVEIGGSEVAVSNIVDARVAEPYVTLDSKTITTTPSDAGDAIVYQIVLTNNDTGDDDVATAFNINVRDALDSNLDLVNLADVNVSTPGYATVTNNSNIATELVDVEIDELRVGDSVTITVTAQVAANAPAGATISNTATMTYSSVPDGGTTGNATGTDLSAINNGTNIDQRDGAHDGSGAPLNDYNESITSTTTSLATPTIDKLAPTPSNYTIGDVITYTINVTLSEGLTQNLVVVDNLPVSGALDLLRVVDSRVVSLGGSTNAGDNFGGNLSGSSLTIGAAGTPSSSNGGADNDVVTFNFGNVQNAPDGTSDGSDVIVIEVDALVTNVAGNDDGAVLINEANLSFTDPDTGVTTVDDPTDPSITLIEPLLQIDKAITSTTGNVEAGDVVEYTITIDHAPASSADAFDLDVSDTLPSELGSYTLVSAMIGASDVSGALNLSGGGALTTTGDIDLTQVQTLVIVVQGTVLDSTNPGDVLSNSADVTWTSRDGVDPNERGGDGSGENDYSASDAAPDITVPGSLAVTKSADVGTGVVGDVVTYTLQVTVSEGTLTNFAIDDNLPTGVVYLNDAAVTSNPAGVTFGGFSATLVGNQLQIRASSVTNPGNGTDGAVLETDTFEITYSVRIANVAAVNDGVMLVNDADASADGVPDDNDNQSTVTVQEPQLQIDKAITSTTGNVEAGDVVEYTITIDHAPASSADAFDLDVTDTLPSELGSYTLVSAMIGASDVSGALNLSGGGALTTTGDIDLTQVQTLVIVVQGTVLDSTNPGDVLSNSADVTWTSRDGVDPNERGGDGTGENDYSASDAAPDITVPGSLAVTKSADVGTGVVGDVVTYTLQVTVSEGTLTNFAIDDNLPTGVVYLNDAAVTNNPAGVTFGGFSATLVGNQLQIRASSVTNPGNDTDGAALETDTFEITYSVRIDDVGAVTNGVGLVNDADASADGVPDDNDNQTTVTVLEPKLDIDKSINDTTPHYGDVVTYTVVVTHDTDTVLPDSTANAFDLQITDVINDPALSLIGGSVSAMTSGAGTVGITTGSGAADTTIDISLDVLELGQTLTITYDVQVTNDPATFVLGTSLDNTANLRYDTQSGAGPERVITDSDPENATIVGADLSITKTDGVTVSTPGDSGTYAIEVRNNGTDVATGVVVTDTLPAGISFVGANLGGSETAPGVVTWNIASIPIGGVVNLTLDYSVDTPAPAGFTQYTNTVSAIHDDTEPTPVDNSASDANTINASPDLSINKIVAGAAAGFDSTDPIQYTITVQNLGTQNASGVTVIDTFPSIALDFVGVGPNVVAPGPGDSTFVGFDGTLITWNLNTVEVGETITLDVSATVKAPLPILITSFTNIVDIADDGLSNPDPDPTNDRSTADADLISRPDIKVTKTDGLDEVRPGDPIEYEILIENIGTQNSTGIVVTDTFPTDLLENVVASDGGVIDFAAGTIVWEIPFLAGFGDSVSFTVNATIAQPTPPGVSAVVNQISAVDDGTNGPDINPFNNESEDVTELALFAFDSIRNQAPGTSASGSLFDPTGEDDFFGRRTEELQFVLPTLPVSPIYSGWAEPGTTIQVSLRDQLGNIMGSQTVVVDAGGNWVTTFPNVIINHDPHAVAIDQTIASNNASTPSGFNFRTYFSPAIHGHHFWSRHITPEVVAATAASVVLDSMLQGDLNPTPVGSGDSYGYEYLTSSSTPSQYAS